MGNVWTKLPGLTVSLALIGLVGLVLYKEITLKGQGEYVQYDPSDPNLQQNIDKQVSKLHEFAVFPLKEVRWKQFFLASCVSSLLIMYLMKKTRAQTNMSLPEQFVAFTFLATVCQMLMNNYKAYHGWRNDHAEKIDQLYHNLSNHLSSHLSNHLSDHSSNHLANHSSNNPCD